MSSSSCLCIDLAPAYPNVRENALPEQEGERERERGEGSGRELCKQGLQDALPPVSSPDGQGQWRRRMTSCDAAVTQPVTKGNPRGYGRLATPFRPSPHTLPLPYIPLHIARRLDALFPSLSLSFSLSAGARAVAQ